MALGVLKAGVDLALKLGLESEQFGLWRRSRSSVRAWRASRSRW